MSADKLKVLHLSTYDVGGGATAAIRLHNNLRRVGVDSRFLTMRNVAGTDGIYEMPKYGIFLRIINRIRLFQNKWQISKVDPRYCFFDSGVSFICSPSEILEKVNFKPDVIIAHWISGFLSAKDLAKLSMVVDAPVIWYLMDMGPLTGGCHYAWDCKGYTLKCGCCPALYSNDKDDFSSKYLKKKSKYLQKTNIVPVAGTEWLFRQVQNSSLFKGKKKEKILIGIDQNVFKPAAREQVRRQLGLPLGKKIIFFGAGRVSEPRKGLLYLKESLMHLASGEFKKKDDTVIVTAGHDDEAWREGEGYPFEHKHLGVLRNDKELAAAYQAADVFVCPSIEDSGPMMINEAIMCGTPVVSFEMGVALDLVQTGHTGYRAKLKDSRDLANGIKYILELGDDESLAISENCRKLGTSLLHPDVQARAFFSLIQSLLSRERNEFQ